MPSSVLNSTPEASPSPDSTATALDWLVGQLRTPILDGKVVDARLKLDWPSSLDWSPDPLGSSLARDMLHDLAHAHLIEVRDPLSPNTPFCNPLDEGTPYDFDRLVRCGRASVTPADAGLSDTTVDPATAAQEARRKRKWDEYVQAYPQRRSAQQVAEGFTIQIEPVPPELASELPPGTVNPLSAPDLRITSRFSDLIHRRAVRPPHSLHGQHRASIRQDYLP